MKKNFFVLAGLLSIPVLLNGQTLKKQNQILKDSIEVVNQRFQIEHSANQTLQIEVANLKKDHGWLVQKHDSLNQVFVKLNERYEYETDSLLAVVSDVRAENERLEVTIDSLNGVVSGLEHNLDSAVAYKLRQEKVWKRAKYFNFGYDMQDFTNDKVRKSPFTQEFSFSMTTGRTFYLHRRPILDMIKFGLDWSYFDLTYGRYESDYEDDECMNKAEVGMQFGPSVTVNPVDYLKVSAYFRYAPSYAMAFDDDFVFHGGFGSFYNVGLSVAYKVISVGIEHRWGTSSFVLNDLADWSTKDLKLYIGFRF